METNLEHRIASECRLAGVGTSRRLVGYASVFDQEAMIGNVREIVRRGAFAKSLSSGRDILGLVDHDPGRLLGRTKTGSLRLREDERGLAFEITLPDTAVARDVLALADRGDLGGASFGFLIPPGGERWQGKVRELVEVDLREISAVVSWPAYAGTSVSARSKADHSQAALFTRLRVEFM
ncbi:HK97 family phage prohead protease [Parvularcula flava]|uniref:HK97 family phage prohead protease n=1 Tax=Aquisalinus luteolus TaxID=1566827 RepID=A0A8J3A1G5_9PROT|nr:HK97 family phage prohead protease [Aquisalinus luteolus]NHK27615.1 HK97 family phage prohead protease [Aquisalinus luteolus]GGH95972.1 hypothetical protein GCM10011355_13780 [Aquisalinus luteolus]